MGVFELYEPQCTMPAEQNLKCWCNNHVSLLPNVLKC